MVHVLYTVFNDQPFDEVCYATRLHWLLLGMSADGIVERLFDAVRPLTVAVIVTYVCRRLLIDSPTIVFGTESNLLPVMVCVVGSETVLYVDVAKLYQFIVRCRRVHMLCQCANLQINGTTPTTDSARHSQTSSSASNTCRDLESLLRRLRPSQSENDDVVSTGSQRRRRRWLELCDGEEGNGGNAHFVLQAFIANASVVNLLWYLIFALEGACGSLERRLPCGVLTVSRPLSTYGSAGGAEPPAPPPPPATLKRKSPFVK